MSVEKITISGSDNIIEGKTLPENTEDVVNADECKTVKYENNQLSITSNKQERSTNKTTKRDRKTLSYADVVRDGSNSDDERQMIRQ